MAQLAIKGHPERGNEVIQLLEMLGGDNKHNYSADCDSLCFYIGKGVNTIYYDWVKSCYEDNETLVFTIEEFLKKFPYKVGDKVYYDVCDIQRTTTIVKMEYNEDFNDIDCTMENGDIISQLSESMQPYKEEIMEERKYSELRMPLDDDDKLAIEVTIDGNKITPPENYLIGKITKVDNGMLVEFVKKQSQYPKTFIDVLNFWHPDRQIEDDYQRYYKKDLIEKFQDLLYARDAYWKIAGDWKPDWSNATQRKYCIVNTEGNVQKWVQKTTNKILTSQPKKCEMLFMRILRI